MCCSRVGAAGHAQGTRMPGSSTADGGHPQARLPGRSTGRISWATPSATCSSTRATAARCWRRRRRATSARPCSAPPTWGQTWKEARQPPAFAKPTNGLPARSVDHTFWLTPGHASERDSWYAGTSPQGLFRSEDGGITWVPLPAVNDNAQFREWMGTVQDGTPDGPKLHSIVVDPRDPAHLLFGMSGGGVHESRDAGRSWTTLIEGMEVVEGLRRGHRDLPRPALRAHLPRQPRSPVPAEPLRHLPARPARHTWQRIGRGMPATWATSASRWSSTRATRHGLGVPDGRHRRLAAHQPGGRPAAYVTRDGGRTWQRLDQGLPQQQAWWTVKRQAMTADALPEPGALPGHHQRRAVDRARRRRALGQHRPPPARDLRGGSGRGRSLGVERADSGGAALLHGPSQVEAMATRCTRCLPTSTAATPACASAWSTSRTSCGRTCVSSSTACGVRDLGHALQPDDFVAVVLALSGG
jgi:hypothetical protein